MHNVGKMAAAKDFSNSMLSVNLCLHEDVDSLCRAWSGGYAMHEAVLPVGFSQPQEMYCLDEPILLLCIPTSMSRFLNRCAPIDTTRDSKKLDREVLRVYMANLMVALQLTMRHALRDAAVSELSASHEARTSTQRLSHLYSHPPAVGAAFK